jgi:alpha-L-arabinofuranosidase
VRGFTMRHAATPWAPPTAEQIGLIGTHWSKGWIIEDNVHQPLGLHRHHPRQARRRVRQHLADTAEGYVKTIERAP